MNEKLHKEWYDETLYPFDSKWWSLRSGVLKRRNFYIGYIRYEVFRAAGNRIVKIFRVDTVYRGSDYLGISPAMEI